MPFKTVDNNELVIIGQRVWVYPANGKRGGSIDNGIVAMIGAWSLTFMGGRQFYNREYRRNLYSTEEAALNQRAIDKAEPSWMRKGKLRINCCATLIKYLSHRTGIDVKNLHATKTEAGWLHLAWYNNNGKQPKGLRKEKFDIGSFYHLKEEILEGIIAEMS